MSDIESIFDLANHIGFDAIDAEVSVWIEQGEFDYAVTDRAEAMGITMDERHQRLAPIVEQGLQGYHRLMHPDGPYGWEFCGRCL